ncbi:hypothetical protein BDN72DRAFT_861294 [Pluteus cervinus]|uniref:Uncharacterized protein n=1 Tax=Pluteus cervinus TaxID=181527 RepID=A0ACD3AF79_9AGAR|nr:hypothetical protein BDN72DRAFT_861294 [Pluteus cervinus]
MGSAETHEAHAAQSSPKENLESQISNLHNSSSNGTNIPECSKVDEEQEEKGDGTLNLFSSFKIKEFCGGMRRRKAALVQKDRLSKYQNPGLEVWRHSTEGSIVNVSWLGAPAGTLCTPTDAKFAIRSVAYCMVYAYGLALAARRRSLVGSSQWWPTMRAETGSE